MGRLEDEEEEDVAEWSGAPCMLGGDNRELGVPDEDDEAAPAVAETADGDEGEEGIISSVSIDDRDFFLLVCFLSNNFLKNWNFSILWRGFFLFVLFSSFFSKLKF